MMLINLLQPTPIPPGYFCDPFDPGPCEHCSNELSRAQRRLAELRAECKVPAGLDCNECDIADLAVANLLDDMCWLATGLGTERDINF